jgi:hypothetical protein
MVATSILLDPPVARLVWTYLGRAIDNVVAQFLLPLSVTINVGPLVVLFARLPIVPFPFVYDTLGETTCVTSHDGHIYSGYVDLAGCALRVKTPLEGRNLRKRVSGYQCIVPGINVNTAVGEPGNHLCH